MKNLNFIQRLTRRLGILYDATVFNFYGIILLLLVYLFYWNFPQAKELLLALNQEGWFQVTLFFATLVTMAAINWYLPRYLYAENSSKIKSWRAFFEADMTEHCVTPDVETLDDDQAYRRRLIEMVPRLIGAFILMVVALGVLNVGHEIAPHRLPWIFPAGYILLGLILLTAVLLLFGRTNNPLLFTFSDLLRDTIGNWIYGYLMVVAVLLGIALFFNAGDLNSLQFLMYSLVLVSFSFLFVVMARRNIAWINKDARVIKIICILAVSLSLCFLLINFIPSLSQHINPLICANLAFVFYLTLLYFFRILGVSLKSYIVFFFLLTALIVANVTTSSYHHEIDYATGEEARFQPDRRLDMREYLQRWVDDRAPQIRQYLAERRAADSTSNPRYPLLVISSEGGGSRSAYWTNIVHDYLDQQIPAYYDQHIFGLTGASGGNTGNSTYFSMKQAGVVQDSIHSYARQMFMGNFLSSSLTLLMGADLWRSTLGLKMGTDRAKQLEYEWTKQLSDVSQGQVDGYSDPFLNFWYESGDTRFKDQRTPPILLLNTTHVQSGGHAIVSPVQLRANFYQAMDLLQVIDTMSRGKKTIRLSTANLLNASFPYINPAGNVKNVGSFVDAGYYDNYGAQSGRGILLHLRHLRDSMKQSTAVNADLYQQLVFYSILIRNGTVDPSPTRNTAISQLVAPASALGKLRSGFNTNNRWQLREAADPGHQYDIELPKQSDISVVLPGHSEAVSPIVPLARYLTSSALEAMDEGLRILERNDTSDLNRLIQDINQH